MEHLIISLFFFLPLISAQMRPQDVYCFGRDLEACEPKNDGSGTFLCTFHFTINMHMTMTYDATPRNNVTGAAETFNQHFPVQIDKSASPYSSLYYRKCNTDMYSPTGNISEFQCDAVKPVGQRCEDQDTTLTPYDLQSVIQVDGVRRKVTAINGQVPGPTICVNKGDEIVVLVTMDLGGYGFETVSVHWHGMFQRDTMWFDGVAYVTQCPICHGQDFTYKFKADPAGTFWYHSHVGMQYSDGVYGAMIIFDQQNIVTPDGAGGELRQQDGTYTANAQTPEEIMFISDWFHEDSQELFIKNPRHWVLDNGTTFVNQQSLDGTVTNGIPFQSALINGIGSYGDNNIQPYMFYVQYNGTDGANPTRFRMINGGNKQAFIVSIDDHRLEVITLDGFDVYPSVMAEAIVIHTGERYDFLIHPDSGVAHINATFSVRAQTLAVTNEPQIVKAILMYVDASPYGGIRAIVEYLFEDHSLINDIPVPPPPTTTSTIEACKADSNRECIVVNCPWPQYYVGHTNIRCVLPSEFNVHPNDTNTHENPPDVNEEGIANRTIYLNLNILGDPCKQPPNIDGVAMKLPPTTLLLNENPWHEIPDACPNFSGVGNPNPCTRWLDLDYNKTYIFVLTNRWPAASGASNFPGAMAHPLHMHGHAFFLLAESAGTVNEAEIGNTELGCQNGIGEPSPYCYDEQTQVGNLTCLTYFGNCRFKDGYFPELKPVNEAPRKDTLIIPVHGWAVIAIRADNPGWWFTHCHIEAHVAGGMGVVINEAWDESQRIIRQKLPGDFPRCNDFKALPPQGAVVPLQDCDTTVDSEMGPAETLTFVLSTATSAERARFHRIVWERCEAPDPSSPCEELTNSQFISTITGTSQYFYAINKKGKYKWTDLAIDITHPNCTSRGTVTVGQFKPSDDIIIDFTNPYGPTTTSAKTGQKITIQWQGKHCVEWLSCTGADGSELTCPVNQTAGISDSNKILETGFSIPGNYVFWCCIHENNMKGTIAVEPATVLEFTNPFSQTTKIQVGESIKWNWVGDSSTHCVLWVTCPNNNTACPVSQTEGIPGSSADAMYISVPFQVKGDYEYICCIHTSSMGGTVQVSAVTETVQFEGPPFTENTTIPRGGAVRIQWSQTSPHCVDWLSSTSGYTPPNYPESGSLSTGDHEFVFDIEGTYEYQCCAHGISMHGFILVQGDVQANVLGEEAPQADFSQELLWGLDRPVPTRTSSRVGDTVSWRATSETNTPHDVTFTACAATFSCLYDPGCSHQCPASSVPLSNGQIFKHTFDTAGIYEFQDSQYPHMAGVIEVVDAAGPSTAELVQNRDAVVVNYGFYEDGGSLPFLIYKAETASFLRDPMVPLNEDGNIPFNENSYASQNEDGRIPFVTVADINQKVVFALRDYDLHTLSWGPCFPQGCKSPRNSGVITGLNSEYSVLFEEAGIFTYYDALNDDNKGAVLIAPPTAVSSQSIAQTFIPQDEGAVIDWFKCTLVVNRTVNVGQVVTWIVTDDLPHTVDWEGDTFPNSGAFTGIGMEHHVLMDIVGTFKFYCEFHTAECMSGEIEVTDAGALPCDFDDSAPGFLAGFACYQTWFTEQVAKELCCECPECAGVTCSTSGHCTLRKATFALASSGGEISYQKTVVRSAELETCMTSFGTTEHPSRYLATYACDNENRFASILDAKEECCLCVSCNGITQNAAGEYTIRADSFLYFSATNEMSVLR